MGFVSFDQNRILDILLGEPLLVAMQCLRPVRQHQFGPQGCEATGVWGRRGVGPAGLWVVPMRWGTFMVVNMVATLCPALRIFIMSSGSKAAVGHLRAKGMGEMNATSGIKSWACS